MNLGEIKAGAASMADKVCGMMLLIEKGFMENKLEHLSAAIEEENKINGMEKGLTKSILALSKAARTEAEKKELSVLEQVVETLERMGDEAASLVERIEIKVAEKLMFSETGVEQFNETYAAMKGSVEMAREFLRRPDPVLREKVIDNGFHVKELVERYRKEHAERLVKGICTPMAANMFFDMLDFTGNLARHSSNIVKSLS
jgi:phosphate:Na+ symporter